MNMIVDPARFDGGPSYPYSLPITNPGAETGDTTGWAHTFGAGIGVNSALTASRGFDGTYHFILSTSDPFVEVVNYVDIPSQYHADIDDGIVEAQSFYKRLVQPDDGGRGRLEFWSAAAGGGVFLGQTTTAFQNNNSTPAPLFTNTPRVVPPGTRSIGIFFFGLRQTGTELSYYFDSVAVELQINGTHNENIYAAKGEDPSGWTVATGSGQPPSTVSWSNWGWRGIYGNSQAAYGIYKEFTPSADALAAIAANSASMALRRYAWNENGDDTSRSWLEARDGSNAVVATVQDAAANTNWGTIIDTLSVMTSGSAAIPTTAVKFRMNHTFGRVDGTVLDAQIAFVHAWMSW